MAILETDLKLITATETLDRSTSVSGSVSHSGEQTAYQLSHDFLVPSIRDWLSSRQRETFRGRLPERLTESPDASIAARRRTSLAAALLLTLPDPGDTGELWTLLKRAPAPDVRHQLVHHLYALNVPPTRPIWRLRLEGDPGVTRALLMALGEYPPDDPAISDTVKSFVRDQFRNDPDARVHSSAEWLLRRWNSFVESDRVPVRAIAFLMSGGSSLRGPPTTK